ncbi:MAG: FMN-binding negative transcriptional regulator [Hyphomonadaceae bacterium]
MYVPHHFATDDADALIARLARRWAGVLITIGDDGAPVATHMPIQWDRERRVATGHIARANPQWKRGPGKGLIVLSGPEAYVTPAWYPSKAEHGKAVPTWNYEAVHVTGHVEWFDDAKRLEAIVRDLSALHEQGRDEPWAIGDAPAAYIGALLGGFVGVTLTAERVEAKRKLSQNKSEADFDGVTRGMTASSEPMAQEIAALMRAERATSGDPDGN